MFLLKTPFKIPRAYKLLLANFLSNYYFTFLLWLLLAKGKIILLLSFEDVGTKNCKAKNKLHVLLSSHHTHQTVNLSRLFASIQQQVKALLSPNPTVTKGLENEY